MSTISDKFKERLNYLNDNSKISPPQSIKGDTFNKYLRGERFPNLENLEIIKEHYHVSYSYLFGEFDNDDLETTKTSIILGLDNDVIKKLSAIQKSDDKIARKNKMFAINTFLRELDFNTLGKILVFPSYNNKNISSNDYYNSYARFFETDIPQQLISYLRENNELSSYRIYKQVSNLCEMARKSKECVDVFKMNLEAKERLDNERIQAIIDSYSSFNNEDFNNDNIDYTKDDINKLIENRKEKIGI